MSVGSALRHCLLAQALTLAVAITVFVGHRNHTYIENALRQAEDAAERVATNRPQSLGVVEAVLIGPAVPSKRFPFLSRRTIQGRSSYSSYPSYVTDLSDTTSTTNTTSVPKKLHDVAGRVDREGAFSELLDDGALALAAKPVGKSVAVAITRPATGPAPLPWQSLLGLFVTGLVLAGAGALLSPSWRTALLCIGGTMPAILAYAWGGLVPVLIIVALAAGIAWMDRHPPLRFTRALSEHRVSYGFVLPTALAMAVLVIAPFFFGLALGFYDHRHGNWTFVGFSNFVEILSGGGRSLSDPLNFWFTLGVTVAWTAVNVCLHVGIGATIALALSKTWIFGRGVFRVLLILPWAIPNYITALVWHGMFQGEYGALNGLLETFGITPVSWFASFSTAFFANVCTNTWLGFPFMMVVALGALQTIPPALYEAAEVDGATSFQRFRHITLPHLWPAMVPAMTLGAIWTFNMFNVIYLVSGGQPGGATDILVTEAYRWAFERGERYGLAAAYATLIFGILLLWAVFGTRILRGEKTT
jgi:ABC-type sugar transport system permease subunit